MRAVVLEGPGSVAVVEVDEPVLPGPDGAVITVEHTGICGSDLHLYHGTLGVGRVRLGHEAVGTVAAIGPEVRSLSVGDRVAVSGVIGCGRCRSCLAGDPVCCANHEMAVFGTGPALSGGQAEAMAVPHADAFTLRVPDEVTDAQAVLLTDILPTGYLAAVRADLRPGASLAVIGLGPVGVCALQCALLFGPGRVFAVDAVADRLTRAAAMGAEPVDASTGDAPTQILERTGGTGVDAVIEAVGSDATITDAVSMAAPGATVSVVGVNVNMAMPFPMALVLLKNLTVRAAVASIPSTWGPLLALLRAGRLRPDAVCTHRLGLAEAPRAYAMFDRHDEGVLKIVLDPTA